MLLNGMFSYKVVTEVIKECYVGPLDLKTRSYRNSFDIYVGLFGDKSYSSSIIDQWLRFKSKWKMIQEKLTCSIHTSIWS